MRRYVILHLIKFFANAQKDGFVWQKQAFHSRRSDTSTLNGANPTSTTSPSGVYVIETKTRRKKNAPQGKQDPRNHFRRRTLELSKHAQRAG